MQIAPFIRIFFPTKKNYGENAAELPNVSCVLCINSSQKFHPVADQRLKSIHPIFVVLQYYLVSLGNL